MSNGFLPISRLDMEKQGIEQLDFVYVIGDAYVDHPSFGHAIISRVLEAHGYKVGIISQPDWREKESVNRKSLFRVEEATGSGCVHTGRRDGKTPGLRDHCLLQSDQADL